MSTASQDLNDSLPMTETASQVADSPLPPRNLRGIISLDDFEIPARRYIPRPIFGYVKSGSEREESLSANRAAYAEFALVPSPLVDTSKRTQSTTIFGRRYDSPFGVSPMGGISLGAYQGDVVMARSAESKKGIPPSHNCLAC